MLKTGEAAEEKEFPSVPAGAAGAAGASFSSTLLAQTQRSVSRCTEGHCSRSHLGWVWTEAGSWSSELLLCGWSLRVCDGCSPGAEGRRNHLRFQN